MHIEQWKKILWTCRFVCHTCVVTALLEKIWTIFSNIGDCSIRVILTLINCWLVLKYQFLRCQKINCSCLSLNLELYFLTICLKLFPYIKQQDINSYQMASWLYDKFQGYVSQIHSQKCNVWKCLHLQCHISHKLQYFLVSNTNILC